MFVAAITFRVPRSATLKTLSCSSMLNPACSARGIICVAPRGSLESIREYMSMEIILKETECARRKKFSEFLQTSFYFFTSRQEYQNVTSAVLLDRVCVVKSKKVQGTHLQVDVPCNFYCLPHIIWSGLLKISNLNRKHTPFQTNDSGVVWMCPRSEVF